MKPAEAKPIQQHDSDLWHARMLRGTTPDGRTLFNQEHYQAVLRAYLDAGYAFLTLHQYLEDPLARRRKVVLLRHDVDKDFKRLTLFSEVEDALKVPATYFVRVHAAYNVFSYPHYRLLKRLLAAGHEVGLHSNFRQFAEMQGEDPLEVLAREAAMLRAVLGRNYPGMAAHRDIDYLHNSIDLCHQRALKAAGLRYHAYQEDFFHPDMLYVNESFANFLDWGKVRPDRPILEGKSAYILTHPHWWFSWCPNEAD